MLTIRKYSLFSILIFVGFSFGAQTAYAKSSLKKVNLGQEFEYAINIIGEATSYIAPEFNEFNIVSGPNTSFSLEHKSGISTKTMRLYWTLSAKTAGKIIIKPAAVRFEKIKIETNSIRIKVRNKKVKHIQLN